MLDVNTLNSDIKVLELIEKQHRYNQIDFKKKTIIQELQKLQQSLAQ